MQNQKYFKVDIGVQTENIPGIAQSLIDQVEKVCRIPERERFQIFLALVEGMNNAVVHGNLEVESRLRLSEDEYESMIQQRQKTNPYKNRVAEVHCEMMIEQVVFRIQNEGPGFDVSKVADPTIEENLDKPSGRGLLILKTFFDEVQFNESGTQLTLTKMLPKVADVNECLPHVVQRDQNQQKYHSLSK